MWQRAAVDRARTAHRDAVRRHWAALSGPLKDDKAAAEKQCTYHPLDSAIVLPHFWDAQSSYFDAYQLLKTRFLNDEKMKSFWPHLIDLWLRENVRSELGPRRSSRAWNDTGWIENVKALQLFDDRRLVLPECFGALTALKTLTVSNIATLPRSFAALTALQKFHVNGNVINGRLMKSIPENFSVLTRLGGLQLLDLRNNQLRTLPDWFSELRALQELILQNNNIYTTFLDEGFRVLTESKALRKLNLSHNELRALPSWFRELTKLEELNIGANNWTQIPAAELNSLAALTTLRLDDNRSLWASPSAYFSSTLQTLTLHDTSLTDAVFPAWLYTLPALETLDLSGNELTTLSFSKFTTLRSLDLSGNVLLRPPLNYEFRLLRMLQKLTMDTMVGAQNNNPSLRLATFSAIAALPNLRELSLRSNRLPTLPVWLRDLTALKKLNLSGNQLSTMPDWFGDFKELEEIDLSSNQLLTLEPWVDRLTALKYLDVSRNVLGLRPPRKFGSSPSKYNWYPQRPSN